MPTFVEYKLPLLFSSDPASGAENVSADGGAFSVTLETPLSIPRDAHNCYVTCQEASAWWTMFNVVEGVNDRFGIDYDDGGGFPLTAILQVDAGLYDLDHLSAEIGRNLHTAGFPDDLFILIPDTSTGKTVIQFNYLGTRLNLAVVRNFANLIGFEERLVPLAGPTTGVQYEKGDEIANFNSINYLTITSDIVSRGLATNGKYYGVIAQILINVPPGSQILSTPFNPPEIPTPELIGEHRKRISFRLTDQNNNQVNTQGEFFTARLVIHYSMAIDQHYSGQIMMPFS